MTVALDPSGDQAEIRRLIESYAVTVDTDDPASAAMLFIGDGEFDVWLNPGNAEPTSQRRGHAEIATALGYVARYVVTHHTISASAIELHGDTATGRTQCAAHHVSRTDDGWRDEVMYLTYTDRFARVEGRWRFARRELRVRWRSVLPVESA